MRKISDLTNRPAVLITGPSPAGIGAETAFSLATGGPALLILAGRSKSKIQPVIDEIAQHSPGVKTAFVHLELDNQKSVRQAAEDVKKLEVQIDGLINNAAVMTCPYAKTADGIELQFGTNHIGHFLFTNLLLQAGVIPDGAHIVNVSSSAAEFDRARPCFDDITYQDGATYDEVLAYGASKLANVLFTRSLAEKLRARKIVVLSLNPGAINSNLQRHMTDEIVQRTIKYRREDDPSWKGGGSKTLQEGCSTTLRAALDPSLAGELWFLSCCDESGVERTEKGAYFFQTGVSGAYFADCQVKEPPLQKNVYPDADKVWALSEKLVGQQFRF